MKKVLTEIQNGKFARGWIKEASTGKKKYHKLLAGGARHPIEKTGARLRGLMPWIGKKNIGGAQASY
jgi:ketol-acid reductoisomerase